MRRNALRLLRPTGLVSQRGALAGSNFPGSSGDIAFPEIRGYHLSVVLVFVTFRWRVELLRARRSNFFRRHLTTLPPNPSVAGVEDDRADKTAVEKLRSENRELFALLEISQTLAKTLEAERFLAPL